MRQKIRVSEVEKALQSQRSLWPGVSERAIDLGDEAQTSGDRPHRIILVGEGSSLSAAQLAYWMLRKQGLRREWKASKLFVFSAADALLSESFDSSDFLIGVTHRGRTQTVSDVLKKGRARGARCARVLSQDVTLKVRASELRVPTGPLEKVEPHTQALSTALCALTSFLGESKYWKKFWRQAALNPDPSLSELRYDLKKRYGRSSGPQILVGRADGEALARELQLKFLEMARFPSWVFSSESFFHGPQWALAAKGRPEMLIPSTFFREARRDEYRLRRTAEFPSVSEGIGGSPCAQVLENLVRCHWMALALALNLGLNPDAPNLVSSTRRSS